jgi:outer membrane lipoprotein-sorting protein
MIRIFLNGILSSSRKLKYLFPLCLLLALGYGLPSPGEASDRTQILEILEKMKRHFQNLEDYSCEVEQSYFQNGEEAQRIYFRYYFRKDGRIRIDFSYPQTGTTLLYRRGEAKATVLPIRSLPGLRFQFSVQSPLLRTYTGQQVDQTDMGYFIEFLKKSLAESEQRDFEFREDGENVTFWILARDYLQGKNLEKYRIALSKTFWLPLRVERFSLENIPIEKSLLHGYLLNARPDDKFFLP